MTQENIIISRHAFVHVAARQAPVLGGPMVQGFGVTPEEAIVDMRDREQLFMQLHDRAQGGAEPQEPKEEKKL